MSSARPTTMHETAVLATQESSGVRGTSEPLRAGSALGQFVVEGLLGVGGFGEVYRARHVLMARDAAVKVLHASLAASPHVVARFLLEAQAACRVRHPGVAEVFEIGSTLDGRPFLAMELLSGEPLDAIVGTHGPLGIAETMDVGIQLCAALQAAHEAGVVHRDVKPSNVMVGIRDGRRDVKLLDFGIAKLLERDKDGGLTVAGQRVGTPLCMAPEQLRGDPVTAMTDVYAMGVLLFYTATGAYPFDAEDATELEALHLGASPPSPSGRQPSARPLDAIVARCLRKVPSERYPSAAALGSALAGSLRTDRAGVAGGHAHAMGIHVRVSSPDADADVVSVAIADALDAVSDLLESRGFDLGLRSAEALLATRLDGPPDLRADGQAVVGCIEAIGANMDVALRPQVTLHAADAAVRNARGRRSVAGGPILQLDTWPLAPPTEDGALRETAAARALRSAVD